MLVLPFLFVTYFCSLATGLQAGDYFKLCKRNDPELGNCIKDSLNQMKPLLRKGIPQLKIPSLDPMVIPRVNVKQGSGPVSMDSTFTNLKINGITDFTIKNIRPDLDNNQIDFEATLPYMYNVGDYKIEGKILVLPISGNGDSWSNYTDVNIKATLKGEPEAKGGKTFFKIKEFKFDLNVGRAIIHLNNLFNGNKELGDAMNNFMIENWEVVYKELKPVVNEAVSAILLDVAQKVFNRFPMDELFLQ
ncbi:protein takeout-like [Rhodnius prolixus]|uniref:Putative odorant binding protein n=1 Tax=Rhodnius prolixus TaxID=13249 RepID=R4G2S7_RHOPR